MKKFKMGLRIFGKKVIPEEITHDLNLAADYQHKAEESEEIYSKKGKLISVVTHHQGMWSKKIEAKADEDFHALLRRALKILINYKDAFFKYRKRGYKIDLFCGVWYDEGENPIIIDNELVKQLEEINVKIEMDEYWI